MKQITVMEKYPVFTIEIEKNETSYSTIDEMFAFIREQIAAHPVATYIGEFDHYAHTTSLAEGKMDEEILAAKNLICCFGKVLPKPEVLAVRPRSIGIAEKAESFVISFMEAPNAGANKDMEKWVKALVDKKA